MYVSLNKRYSELYCLFWWCSWVDECNAAHFFFVTYYQNIYYKYTSLWSWSHTRAHTHTSIQTEMTKHTHTHTLEEKNRVNYPHKSNNNTISYKYKLFLLFSIGSFSCVSVLFFPFLYKKKFLLNVFFSSINLNANHGVSIEFCVFFLI